MEQLRVFLEVVKKYHFWILCGLIVLIAFGSWYLSTGERAAYYKTRKGKLDAALSGAQRIKNDHPTQVYIDAIKLRETGEVAKASDEVKDLAHIHNHNESLAFNVASANTRLFEEQGRNNNLPPVYADPADQARFEEAFRAIWNHKIEDIEKQPPLDVNYRNQYRDRIKDFFPRLFDMIDRRKEIKDDAAAGNARGGVPGFGAKAGDDRAKRYEGIVDWADADRLMERFQKWNDTPTTLQVMLAQEDLWVYEALLRVVRNTNDSSTGHDQAYKPPPSHKMARIKEIVALEIGNEALQSWAHSENSVITIAAEGGDAARPAMPAPGPVAPAGKGQASYLEHSGAVGGSTLSPLAGRYVDNGGKPLADPTQQPNDEFRMMPIDIQVIMEQKDIPRLLVECANSNMRIDVRSVRILEERPPAFNLQSSGQAASSGIGGSGDVPQGMNSRGMIGGARASHNDGAEYKYSDESADSIYPPVPVEIQGIIYIYNPPENQGDGAGAAAAPAAASGPATAPAGTAPAGTTAPAGNAPGTTAPGTAPSNGAAPAPGGSTVPATPNPLGPGAPGPTPLSPPNHLGPAPANPGTRTAPGTAPAPATSTTPASGARP